MEYSRAEAKERAFAKWIGVCNVILPSFTADLKGLNEKAIRHDVRRNIEHGFWGTLLVSECGTTAAEYRQFMEIAVDEAKGRHYFLMHGTFDTPDDIVAMAKAAEEVGVEGILLGHPNSLYPTSENQLYDYLAYVCDRTEPCGLPLRRRPLELSAAASERLSAEGAGARRRPGERGRDQIRGGAGPGSAATTSSGR